jgi:hypothetical protein
MKQNEKRSDVVVVVVVLLFEIQSTDSPLKDLILGII